jgi:Ni,Fe-hydrogenase III small subunit
METALRRTYDATPEPKLVVAIGDCGCTGGIFGESYASCGRVSNVIPVDVAVPGCPPTPVAIIKGILTAIEHKESDGTAEAQRTQRQVPNPRIE